MLSITPNHSAMPACRKRVRQSGQNLVELALTLPFLLAMLFFTIDIGRAWMVYDGAKMAVRDAVYTASIYHSATVGKSQLDNKLAAAGLSVKTAKIVQVPREHAYQGDVTVTYEPMFAQLQIPSLSGPIRLIPANIDVKYTSVTDVAVY